MDETLQPMRGPGGDAAYLALRPKCKRRLLGFLDKLRIQDLTSDRDTWVINICGTTVHGMLGKCPCLTLKGWSRWPVGIFPFKVVNP